MPNKITKANGHIVQPDWAQDDATKMDYIHNKPNMNEYVTIQWFDEVTKAKLITPTDTTISLQMDSNTEYQCQVPITSLTITGFGATQENYSNLWSIMFTAADSISVAYPDTVRWAVAVPIFDPNKTYWLSFVSFGEYYLGVWTVVE